MKKKWFIVISFVAMALGFLASRYIHAPDAQATVEQLKFDSNFDKNSLNDFESDYLIIDFWASWCQPCLESLPYYHQKFKTLPISKFDWLAVNLDTDKTQAQDFLSQLNLSHTQVFFDPNGHLQTAFAVSALPTLLIIDKQGKEVVRLLGFNQNQQNKLTKILGDLTKK
ncbi:TlpA family protein disulfide reductase [Catenovulum adriaticum]|uniref:TlpA family protein disulfide reductase n=1 Tax=Catenovulum adriaticum TaxID=2984846 RepID=A0ABY7AJV7_9ALTE|nr:TlpA disulfide reductase family protein [Catenovulum sp. TS8]WAJ69873.1 TlpA family protein disulfide reductase [Catenovulum sp. TS8]